MVKQRMNIADVACEVACLRQRILGMRVANIYDLSPKVYLIKLARSGEDGEKIFLILESGSRFHTTQYVKDKNDTPSNFTLKLRKHLRTRRLEDVRQLGIDRMVDFAFGTGDATYHLILELYSQGNLVLTDANYEVLTLLRSHRDDAKGLAIMARHPYPIHTVRRRGPLPPPLVEEALGKADEKSTLRGILAGLLPYGPALCEHCILLGNLDPQRNPKAQPLSAEEVHSLLGGVAEWEAWLDALDQTPPQGFISVKDGEGQLPAKQENQGEGGNGEAPASKVIYEDYDPIVLRQRQDRPVLQFPTFDAALDEFYSKMEGQRAQQVQAQQEKSVVSKLDKIRLDQTARAEALEREAKAEEEKAQLIECNLEAVDGAINAVRAALAQGLNWKELKRLIKGERDAGNPVANTIHSLQLERNHITLQLSNMLDDEDGDEDAGARPATLVEVDLDLNAYGNARLHFASRRQRALKQQKTLEANAKALQAAEKKAVQQLSKVKVVTAAQQVRKPYWFERFCYFISSENYLVLSGRDMQQNELLVKRYLRRGDLYVHADLHGASTTIVKNHTPDQPVPPLTIAEAGQACVCRSQAWDAKIVTSAWWVDHQQVSKTAPTGEYLPTGSFMVRGKKNFLPPHPLIMGLGILFKLDESSLAAHLGERQPRSAADEAAAAADAAINAEGATAEEFQEVDSGSSSGEDDGDEIQQAHSSRLSDDGSQGRRTGENGENDVGSSGGGIDRGGSPASGSGTPGGTLGGRGSEEMGAEGDDSALEAFLDSAPDPLAGPSRQGKAMAASFNRYGLDMQTPSNKAAATSPEEGEERDEAHEAARVTRHRTVSQKRSQKQAGSPSRAGSAREQEMAVPQQGPPAAEDGTEGVSLEEARKQEKERREARKVQAEQATAAAARGKKGKAKKAKDKYADQDEEDRQLAMQLLGSAGQRKDRKEKKAVRKEKMAGAKSSGTVLNLLPPTEEELAAVGAQARVERRPPPPGKTNFKGGAAQRAGPNDRDRPNGTGAEDDAHVALEPGSQTAAEKEEIAALLAEENVELVPEDELAKLREIDSLTGIPQAGDILLAALPVCAPYTVLQGYKYKMKLTPGTQRKGRAARQALELLTRSSDIPPREKELIKSIPEMEAINMMVGNVRLSVPGLQKLKMEQRRQKKGK